MTDWDEIAEDGLHVHVRIGLTEDGQGPADPPDPSFDHWGCWCGDPDCPGPSPDTTGLPETMFRTRYFDDSTDEQLTRVRFEPLPDEDPED